MFNVLAARVVLMVAEAQTETLLIEDCISWVLRKMPKALRENMAFNLHIEVLAVIYDATPIKVK